jgi:hypothetical protein
MSVTKEFAVKIDTELSSWYDKRWALVSNLESAEGTKEFYEKHYPTRVEEIQKAVKKITGIKVEIAKVNIEIAGLNKIYNQDPWTRAFLVINSNGHVHSSMDCNTCFPTTRYNWLIQYSNDDENTIVEDAGQDACTICYPSAPAEVLNRPSRIVTADKVAKAQAKAERDAKKVARIAKEKANAPTASGEFLTYREGKYTRVIKTERSAVSEWLNNQYWILNSSNPESQESKKQVNEIICRNLAEKYGVSFDQQLKILENKYQKRRNQ